MKNRILALLLAVCLTVPLLGVPALADSAASAGFSDISDPTTALAVESLRLMGVLDGYGDGTFRPGGSLTRAQFCKMAVYAMNQSSQLGKYRTVTIFPDVKPTYWASSYINLAAKGKQIISGYPDGKFYPERIVTCGQAVSILVRLLGYTIDEVGGIFPDSYMAQASTIGLTDGLSLTAGAALTRGQSARLFLNLLRCNMNDGTAYAASIATVKDDVMLISSTALASDGTNTAMEIGSGTTYSMAYKTSSGVLNGKKGMLLLDKAGKVLTFVPSGVGSSVTVAVSIAAANKLTDTTGKVYVMSSDLSVYYNDSETTWSSVFAWLTPGTTITLYLDATGGVEYVFVGSGSMATTAVLVASTGSTAGFAALAGGTGYIIYKDGVKAGGGDLRQYDVATYSSATNTIRICDTKISGIYEACSPNLSAPSTVTVLGHEFSVLSTAYDTLSKFKLGDQITLLLTEDNQVAGAISGSNGNALGIVKSVSTSSATVNLLCGVSVTGTVILSDTSVTNLAGQLVRVSSGRKNYLSVSRVTGGVSGTLDVTNKKLGSASLRENVVVYQQSGDGLTAVALSQLTASTIPDSAVVCSVTDWAGRVSIIVLGDISGSQYLYGLADYTKPTSTPTSDPDNPIYTNGSLTLIAGSKTYGPYDTGYDITDDTFIGISLAADGKSLSGYVTLNKLSDVSNSAWIGQTAVTTGGMTYTIPSSVLCYNRSAGSWITLTQAHGYATTCNLYVDRYNVVRVIEVN